VAEPLEMDWRFAYADETKRTAVLASREDHCLPNLLWRLHRHEFETTSSGPSARAVRWHVEDRVLVHENRTVVS
jgi:formyltetrahydrofolate hydrolase